MSYLQFYRAIFLCDLCSASNIASVIWRVMQVFTVELCSVLCNFVINSHTRETKLHDKITAMTSVLDICALFVQVFEIISFLPKVGFLNLSDNPLSHSDPFVTEDVTSCSSVCQLVLNSTKISWETVVQLLTLFPQ